MPTSHVPDMASLNYDQLLDLADVLIRGDRALKDVGIQQGKYIFLSQRPIDYKSDFHLFGEMQPHAITGSLERMEDCSVITKHPKYVAATLRELVNSYRT